MSARKTQTIPRFTHIIHFSVTQEMAEAVELLAIRDELTQSALVRAAVLEYLRARIPVLSKPAVNGHHHQEQPHGQ